MGLVITSRTSPSSGLFWSILVGAWSLVFAAPHFYWAWGGRAGLGAQAAAADAALEQSWFAAYNMAAGCLGVAGALVAIVLAATLGGDQMRRLLLMASAVASAVLFLRGALGLTLLGVSLLDGAPDQQTSAVLLAIEPYFLLGGLVFGGMVLNQRRRLAVAGALSS